MSFNPDPDGAGFLRQIDMRTQPKSLVVICAKVFEADLGCSSKRGQRRGPKCFTAVVGWPSGRKGNGASAMQDESNKMVNETVARLRIMAHDLSNAIETVMQASYLLAQSELDDNHQKWLKMIDTAAQEAARINREIREILRSQI